jgi:beta-glucosidase-like glycosyl hydrolase
MNWKAIIDRIDRRFMAGATDIVTADEWGAIRPVVARGAGALDAAAKSLTDPLNGFLLSDAALEALRGRGGFDGWWATIDEETRESIKAEIANAIEDAAIKSGADMRVVTDDEFRVALRSTYPDASGVNEDTVEHICRRFRDAVNAARLRGM